MWSKFNLEPTMVFPFYILPKRFVEHKLCNEFEVRSNGEVLSVFNINKIWKTVRAIKIVCQTNQKRNIQITLKFRLKCLLCFYDMQLFRSVHPWIGFTCFSFNRLPPGHCAKQYVTWSLPFFYFPFLFLFFQCNLHSPIVD